ncbi:TetR/AcrR family transcriptional regulator [Nocardia sp. NPDC052566]|uniref:TetR/AcrR family transcriptional regulator n=1 Tax=Nocardia sp. NPDC052566 TaxID=3364330 RepID=UPI0037C707B3
MTEDTTPADLARLWRLPAGSRLGRPAALDVDRVVRTAIESADRAGLSGATLPKIAETLGVTPMSLYRHIGSKDELLVLMADAATGPPPPAEVTNWRAALRDWAVALRATYLAHPWLPHLPIAGPPRGPNAIAWMDAGLRALRETGLDPGVKVGVITVVSGYVRHTDILLQQLEQGRGGTGRDESQTNLDYARQMARLIDPDRFPDAAALFASDAFAPPATEPADDFGFGLDLVLDGVAATVDGIADGTR